MLLNARVLLPFSSLFASNPTPCSGPPPPPHACLIFPPSPSNVTRLRLQPRCRTGVTGDEDGKDAGGPLLGFWCHRAETPRRAPWGGCPASSIAAGGVGAFRILPSPGKREMLLVLCGSSVPAEPRGKGGSGPAEERTAEDELVSRDEAEYPKSKKLYV